MSIKKDECEYCGEHESVFSIEVNMVDGTCETSDLVCPGCVATFYSETPEVVESMSVVRLEGN